MRGGVGGIVLCRLYNLMSRGLIMIPGGGSPLHTLSQVIWLLHPNEGNYNQGFRHKEDGTGFPPSEDGTMLFHRRMEQCSSIGGWKSVSTSTIGAQNNISATQLVNGNGFFSFKGWNTVSSPLSENGTWFYSSSTLENGTGFPRHQEWATPLSKDGKRCLLRHKRIGQVFAPQPAISGRTFQEWGFHH